ncbi:MAG TPA: serine/threonine-protein kinase, partial [Ruminiclostridium sp.]|nr:serine/threonine-protein kinase [Ruminiclostridium sp.]
GGCGDVYLAENIALGNLWAVKEISKGRDTTISGYLEPEILKRLNHPALPRICDVYEDERCIYIVEDYIEGICLKQLLEDKGRLEESQVAEWAVQLCSVLDYLHGQKPDPIVYGDMKPHNIILAKGDMVKLIDFGISGLVRKSAGKPPGITETAFIGTKGYAAPEQFLGSGISPATDIYSLGITLIQLITGLDPARQNNVFNGNGLSEYLSPQMYEILRNCLNPKPEMRYRSAGQLMKAFRQYLLVNSDSIRNEISQSRYTSYSFSKIIAITGAGGTGTSTITVSISEQVAKTKQSACIFDLSKSGDLCKNLVQLKENSKAEIPVKVKSNLYYQRPAIDSDIASEDDIKLYKLLGQLQEKFSYIFIDSPPEYLRCMEKYLDHIFIITDMNPFNLVKIIPFLEPTGLSGKICAKTSFVINKFYNGELGTDILVQSILSDNRISEELQDLISSADIFEVPYCEKIYLKWMYSYFGETKVFNSIIPGSFDKAISNIISNKIIPQKIKKSLF